MPSRLILSPKQRLIVIVLIGIGLLAFLGSLMKSSLLLELLSVEKLIHWVERIQENPAIGLGFYVAYAVGVMFLPITMFPIMGGVLFGFWTALPLNIVAACMGGWFSFALARLLGRDLVEKVLRGHMKHVDRMATVNGFKTVFILRLLGIPPFIVTNYALGLSGVKTKHFWAGTVLGMTPWMIIITYAAQSLWKALQAGGQQGLSRALLHLAAPLTLISLTILSGMIATYFIKRKKKKSFASPSSSRDHSNL